LKILEIFPPLFALISKEQVSACERSDIEQTIIVNFHNYRGVELLADLKVHGLHLNVFIEEFEDIIPLRVEEELAESSEIGELIRNQGVYLMQLKKDLVSLVFMIL
jgi:hypothetical protein